MRLMTEKQQRERVTALLEMIEINDTKGCPDPVQGGCMGHYCTVCALRALRYELKHWAPSL